MTMAEKIQLIEQVLSFYASTEHYQGPRYISPGRETPLDTFSPVMQDRGQRARDLLAVLHRDLDQHLRQTSTAN